MIILKLAIAVVALPCMLIAGAVIGCLFFLAIWLEEVWRLRYV